jgi:hypothetical protein
MIQLTKSGVNFKVTPSTPELDNFWKTVYQEMWENETFNQIVPHLDKNKTFIDIGAWQGPISLVAQQYSKQCLCFEPDPTDLQEYFGVDYPFNTHADTQEIFIGKK